MMLRIIFAVMSALIVSAFSAHARSTPQFVPAVDVHAVQSGISAQPIAQPAAQADIQRSVKKSSGRVTTSRDCLAAETLSVLERAERRFNTKFKIVSTCREGAVIKGTTHESQHASGHAVDVEVPKSVSKRAVVSWFYANAKGVTMTYRCMTHVHFDVGPYHKRAFGSGCEKKPRYARTR